MSEKTEIPVLRAKHASPGGDLIAALPSLRQAYRATGKKFIIYQQLEGIGQSYHGANHPFKNENNDPIMMNKGMFDMLRPLILYQDYIAGFEVYTGQEIDIDLNVIRLEVFTNQPLGSIHHFLWFAFPEMAGCDLSEKWLNVPQENSKVSRETYEKAVLNFTFRHRNNVVNYYFLKEYEDKLLFAGLPEEHKMFCKQWGLNIPHLKIDSFLELAGIMQGSKMFLGNASTVYHIAEGLKIPRMLETFMLMPNVIPFGANAYQFYHQQHLEYLFKKLMA